jgi:hypothetical protein
MGRPEMSSAPNADQLKAAADQAIAACGGDAREAVKALIVPNHFLETDLEKLKAAVSTGYARGSKAEEPIPDIGRRRSPIASGWSQRRMPGVLST